MPDQSLSGTEARLLLAVRKNNLPVVKKLLFPHDPATKVNRVLYAVYAAVVIHSPLEVVTFLLDHARVYSAAHYNKAIREAVRYGHTEMVRLLLNHPRADSDAPNVAIRSAARYGRTELVRLLLNHPRVDPGALDNAAIRNAAENGHTEVVRFLLNNLRVDARILHLAICNAAENGHTGVVRLLQNNPLVGSEVLHSAIYEAVEKGHTEVVELLLNDPRVDPGVYNNKIIRHAVLDGDTKIVRLLLNNPRVDPINAFYVALQNNRRHMASLLLQDERIKSILPTRFREAVGNGYLVKLLLKDQQLDPSADENDALLMALESGQVGVAKLLLESSRVFKKTKITKELREKILPPTLALGLTLYSLFQQQQKIIYQSLIREASKKEQPKQLHQNSLIGPQTEIPGSQGSENSSESSLGQQQNNPKNR